MAEKNLIEKLKMDIRKSKKGVVHTWFDYVFAIVGGIVIFVIIFFVTTSGTARVENEIKAQEFDIRSDETLVFYLSTCLSKGQINDLLFNNERFKVAEQLAGSKTTFADLIIAIGENDDEDYKEILRAQTEYLLNTTLGNEKWKLDIRYPGGEELSFGGLKGETRVFELRLPSTGYQMINVKLTAKKEK
ncbi:hypothetical protein COV19_06535 [Candidatus Woesearchaeota archaeon CG10_big_fil_rev_8_21_14_0_10_44_13]|nr:MAG: hypothetical protein COV19_06535 [Candidatus Woesearchaeota archaeon CG10_big_fil_rev_8_21_14_0_10_44_13]